MSPEPIALGYLRTDGGSSEEGGLNDEQVSSRRRAIEVLAAKDGLTLKGIYVEDTPGSRDILSRLFAAAYFYIANDEALDAVIVFEVADLGALDAVQAQTRERLDDLGVRLEIVAERRSG
jgi:DNA invertase Pin-like site-specific DNA recombinase